MLTWLRDRVVRLREGARARPAETALAGFALATCIYVIVYPFMVVTYPPMTDLPFHAAEASILRHYLDPAWHFRDQFALHPFDAPYISMYAVGLVFALFVSIVTATKGMAIVMLAAMPLGLAVMFHGMKKSPLWGLLGLELVWCTLTHWAFLNFMGAIGLFALVIGCTLLLLDRPTRAREAWLTLSISGGILYAHLSLPFCNCGGGGHRDSDVSRDAARATHSRSARRDSGCIWPLARTQAKRSRHQHGPSVGALGSYPRDARVSLWKLRRPQEQKLAAPMLWATLALLLLSSILFFAQGRHRGRAAREWWWGAGVTVIPLLAALVYLGCYFVLPMTIGLWWFVYPRELVTAAFISLGVFPDMPRQWWLKLPIVAVIALVAGRVAFYNAEQWHDFDDATADFRAIEASIPQSPKLLSLVFDHSGSTRTNTPFIHLPAWIQAKKGGWLSFHFVGWDVHPIRYRENDTNVPPPRPPRWEWTPERFDVKKDAPWFDWFLVRSRTSPEQIFEGDPGIKLVRREGTWSLYHKQ